MVQYMYTAHFLLVVTLMERKYFLLKLFNATKYHFSQRDTLSFVEAKSPGTMHCKAFEKMAFPSAPGF